MGAKLIKSNPTIRGKQTERPIRMDDAPSQYRDEGLTKQCKSGSEGRDWTTLGKARPSNLQRAAFIICFAARHDKAERLYNLLCVSVDGGNIEGEAKLKHISRSVSTIACAVLATAMVFGTIPAESQDKKSTTDLNVAAAADLSSALKEIGDRFEKKTGVKINLSFGASGALTQQIQNGAPFDLFFSADMDYPRQLVTSSDADGATLYEYAVGKLVLWVPADSALDVEHKGMNILLDPAVKKIAIANPQHAPYGRAAAAALKHAGMYDRVADRLVLGENISQAAQFVESGNAQAGFVALAHAIAPAMRGKGKYWEVPADFYPPLAQGVVVLSHSQHQKEAAEFLNYIKTKEVADLLQQYGFTIPQK
jgi:molybdate transport system substrate-binding protein